MFLNADVPAFDCWVRKEFLYDLRAGHGEFARATVFGVSSVQHRAIGFHAMIHDTGAVIWRLPIHALAHDRAATAEPLDEQQLWDCFSYDVAVTEFLHLRMRKCLAALKSGAKAEGRYLFTIDWCKSACAEAPGETGHKCAHVLELSDGNYAALPNNRVLWADPATNSEPFARRPDYLTNTHVWASEGLRRWGTEDSDRMFYDVAPKPEEPGDATD